MDRDFAANKALSANRRRFSQWTGWWASPALPPLWTQQWQGHWDLLFLALMSLHAPRHGLSWSCCTARPWKPVAAELCACRKNEKWWGKGLSCWKASVLLREGTAQPRSALAGVGGTALALPTFWQLPRPQGCMTHRQFLCVHPIATFIANRPWVRAEELLYRLFSPILLEAELCCSANQHSSWANTT